jgi:anti-anti-sigma regulatory factor
MTASSVSVKVLTWEGSLSVEKASVLKEELMLAFSQASQVVVSLSLMDSIDLAVIQLLKAARIEAETTGKTFHLTGTVKPDLLRAFSVSGFVRATAESARDLETELFGPTAARNKEQ